MSDNNGEKPHVPLDVAKTPLLYEITPAIGEIIPWMSKFEKGPQKYTYEQVAGAVSRTRERLVKENPGAGYAIDTVLDLAFGPFRLPKDVLGSGDIDISEARHSAAMQHNLAHAINFAIGSSSSPEYTSQICKIMAVGNAVSNFGRSQSEKRMGIFWSGVRNEAAIINFLQSAGLRVYVPDYTIEPNKDAPFDDEVLQADVYGHVDFVATSGDGRRVWAIDSKSDRNRSSVYIDQQENPWLPSCLNPLTRNATRITKETVWLPGTAYAFESDGRLTSSKPKDVLKHHIGLSFEVERDLENSFANEKIAA